MAVIILEPYGQSMHFTKCVYMSTEAVPLKIGRQACQLVLDCSDVCRSHALIWFMNGKVSFICSNIRICYVNSM